MRGILACFNGLKRLSSSSQRGNAYRRGEHGQFGRQITTNLAREARVLSFGDGSHGALGHTDCFGGDAYEPTEVEGLPSNIASVGTGHYHSMAVTQTGELWAWGRNSEGQLGQRDTDARETWHQPQRVRGLEGVEVKSAAGSGVVSMAIATDGSLWAWGRSKRGQLGLGSNVTHARTPHRVEMLAGQQVAQVALGWGHTLACTAEGHLYSWGYAANGRLGFQPERPSSDGNLAQEARPPDRGRESSGDMQDLAYRQVQEDMEREKSPVLAWEPVRVDALRSQCVREIACGFDHSLTINDEGELWSFGDNSLGQLGRATAIPTMRSSNLVLENPVDRVHGPLARRRVVHLGAGLGHSLAMDAEGCVYSWGWNAGSQLGRDGRDDRASPADIEDLRGGGVASLAGGRVHSLALTSKGEVWVWGSGKNGRLGLGSSADESVPFPLETLEGCIVVQAACGFDHTLVLVQS